MAVVKEGLEVHEVIIQEGVHTFETVKDAVAEPVVYMIDRYVIGGFYRVHTSRGKDENLNAPGMHFEPLAFDNSCTQPDHFAKPRRDAQPLLRLRRGRAARGARGGDRAGERRRSDPQQPRRGRPAAVRARAMKLLFILDPLRRSRPTRTPRSR